MSTKKTARHPAPATKTAIPVVKEESKTAAVQLNDGLEKDVADTDECPEPEQPNPDTGEPETSEDSKKDDHEPSIPPRHQVIDLATRLVTAQLSSLPVPDGAKAPLPPG